MMKGTPMKSLSFAKAAGFFLLTPALVLATPVRSQVSALDPYVKAVPSTSKMTVCYMTLKNLGKEAVRLVSASSPVAKAVETHNHIHRDGMMKMEKVDSLEIPAGQEVQLKPMSYHLMMIGLKDEFRSAKDVKLTLRFSDGSSLNVTAPIKKD
jgi:hypothetical protein